MATRNLLVRAGFDASGMSRGTRQANNSLRQFGQNANRSMNGLSSSIGTSLGKIGKLMAAAFAIKALIDFGKQCVELGSNLSEVQNVVDVTFGDMAENVNQFAKTAITSLGLSETSAKKYTSTMGAMLKSMGLTTDQALDMSKNITSLSADMASFYNLDADEAFAKIRSGLSGETEPLKQLGINMSVANLQAYAMAQGISKAYSKMTQQEQALLRYNYLLSVTADAQGDFARTSDSWANQTRILSEQFNALKAEIGQGLIAAFTPVVKGLNFLIEKLKVAAGYFRAFMELIFGKQSASGGAGMVDIAESTETVTDNADSASDAVGGIGDAAQAAGKKAKGALASFDELNQLSGASDSSSGSGGGSGTGLSNMGGAVNVDLGSIDENAITGKMQGIATAIQEIFSNFGTINLEPLTASFTRLKEAIAPITETLFAGLKWGIDNVIFPLTKWTIESFLPTFFDLLSGALKVLNPILVSFQPLASFLWTNFLQPIASWTGGVIVSVLQGLAKALTDVGNWMSSNIGVVSGITTAVVGFFGAWKVVELLAFIQMSGGVATAIGVMITALKAGVVAKLADKAQTIALTALYAKDFVVSMATSTAALIKQTAQFVASKVAIVAATVAQVALTVATTAWNVICTTGTALTTAFGIAIGILTSPITLVIGAIAALVTGIVLLIKNWDTVKVAGAKCWDGIKSAWSSAGQWFNTTIITPIGKAFGTMWTGIKTACSNAFNGIKNAVKTPLNWVIDMINKVLKGVNSVTSTLNKVPGVNIGSIPQIPKLAKGGVIDNPTIAMIGEAGREAVVPLQNNTEWTGQVASLLFNALSPLMGSISNNSNGTPYIIELDSRELAKGVIPALQKEMRRTGVRFT